MPFITDDADVTAMLGGSYAISDTFGIALGAIAGHFAASPRFGLQLGFSIDP
jgi:hypothetical protein